ncbi:serine/threonine protein phosphatase [Haematococcus lacustris]
MRANLLNQGYSVSGLEQRCRKPGPSALAARSSARSMFSLFKRDKKKPVVHADAIPATALAVQEVERTNVSSSFVYPGDRPAVLPPGKVLRLRNAVCYLPHPDKVSYGGEDACFISDIGGGALGVADGVGGWQESGVNPADYSRMFMKLACAYLEGKDIFENDGRARSPSLVDPRGALHSAHSNTKVPGSATACVMQLDQNRGTLEAANLGDSGFVVIRQGKVIAKSRPLQHYFDCPLQFGAFPEYVEATDTADMAEMYSIPLSVGDVVVAGSDGLWDNAFESEIISNAPVDSEDVQRAADSIAVLARQHASDDDFPSPYTREALSQGIDLPWWEKLVGASFKSGRLQLKQLTGGKMDDITVLVALVEAADPPAASDSSNAEAEGMKGAGSAAAAELQGPAEAAADNGLSSLESAPRNAGAAL